MWTCSNCGLENIADDVRSCPGCACQRYAELLLSGSQGAITLRTSLWFGNKNLASLIGGDSVYAAVRQFHILRRKDAFYIECSARSHGNPTLINGTRIPEEAIALSQGDVISIGSQSNVDVRKGEIQVSFNF